MTVLEEETGQFLIIRAARRKIPKDHNKIDIFWYAFDQINGWIPLDAELTAIAWVYEDELIRFKGL